MKIANVITSKSFSLSYELRPKLVNILKSIKMSQQKEGRADRQAYIDSENYFQSVGLCQLTHLFLGGAYINTNLICYTLYHEWQIHKYKYICEEKFTVCSPNNRKTSLTLLSNLSFRIDQVRHLYECYGNSICELRFYSHHREVREANARFFPHRFPWPWNYSNRKKADYGVALDYPTQNILLIKCMHTLRSHRTAQREWVSSAM